MTLMYRDKVIADIPDTVSVHCIADCFDAIGIHIHNPQECKIAYARGIPGFFEDAVNGGYQLDIQGCYIIRKVHV